jgi:hypothetical protein
MASYSLLFLRNGERVGNCAMTLVDDLDALDAAYRLCARFAVEVWQSDRCVARVKQFGAPPATHDRHSG